MTSGDLKSQFFTVTPAAPMAPTIELLTASMNCMFAPTVQNAQALGSVYAREGRDTTELGTYFANNRITTGGVAAGIAMGKR